MTEKNRKAFEQAHFTKFPNDSASAVARNSKGDYFHLQQEFEGWQLRDSTIPWASIKAVVDSHGFVNFTAEQYEILSAHKDKLRAFMETRNDK